MNNKPILFARFDEKEILGELGRLLFSLLNAFASNGYQILFFDNIPYESLGKYGKLIHSLDDLRITDEPPGNTENSVYLFDKEDKSFGKLSWRKRIQVRFDIFSPYWFKQPIFMPYPIHPSHATHDLKERLDILRSHKKNIGVFFSGDTKGYRRNWVRYPKAKLPRLEIVNTILERMDDDLLHVKNSAVLNNLKDSAYIQKCVIVDTNNIWVSDKDWLGTLARANFFLSPPGIVMPMCHNIVEAMAVGAIPITNYPEWFEPVLTHMKDCIVFDTQDDLIDKLKIALNMHAEQVTMMRKNAIAYYQAHLNPDSFVRRVESRNEDKIVVLLITENNMAKKSAKFNRNSVLLRGTTSTSKRARFKRTFPYFVHRKKVE